MVGGGGSPWLQKVVLVVLASFVSLGLLGQLAARRRWIPTADLTFPPLPPDSGYVPPMAIVEDAMAISSFVTSSVDDVVEDAAKLMCLVTTARFLHGRFGGGSTGVLAGSLGAGAMYQPCDVLGDLLGDVAQAALQPVLETFGWPERAPPRPAGNRAPGHLLDLADDVVEDAFKLVCVWSHVRMGQVLTDSWAVPLVGDTGLAGAIAGQVVRVGVPAAKYNMCNEYGEFLGKWVHHHISSLTGEI